MNIRTALTIVSTDFKERFPLITYSNNTKRQDVQLLPEILCTGILLVAEKYDNESNISTRESSVFVLVYSHSI